MTSRSPSKLFWLMANIICIILRAVFFSFLSSLSNSILPAFSTWQKSHSTPSDAEMNCMEGISWSAGMSFSTWMFLYFLPAVSPAAEAGAACPCAACA